MEYYGKTYKSKCFNIIKLLNYAVFNVSIWLLYGKIFYASSEQLLKYLADL